MTKAKELSYEVVIVGAGPVGVLAANFLGQYGVRTLIIDREPDVIDIPRAVGLCEEGSRIIAAAKLMEPLEPNILPVEDLYFRDKDLNPLFRVGLNKTIHGNPMLRTIHQPDVERIFRKGLERYQCVDFWKNTECLQFTDLGDSVSLRIRRNLNNGTESNHHIHCRYLLACDGARSSIRKMLPTAFKGQTYSKDWLVIDIDNDPVEDRSDIYFICDRHRPGVTLPIPNGGRRWEFVVKDNESNEYITSDHVIQTLLKPWGDVNTMKITRKTVYTFHAVTSKRFSVGNVFLMGDAAHLTPPFAGQGLMAGMRDAFNLTWKLAHVLEGKLPSGVLNSYDTERRPQADIIIRFAQLIGIMILPENPILASLRNLAFRFGKRFLACQENQQRANIHKTQNNILGYKSLRHLSKGPDELRLGFEFPQNRITTLENDRPRVIDSELGAYHYVVGYRCFADAYLSPNILAMFRKAGGKFCCIDSTPTTHQPINPDRRADLLVHDSQQAYASMLEHGNKLLVIRPDRMVVAITSPTKLEEDLRGYLKSLGINDTTKQQNQPAFQY